MSKALEELRKWARPVIVYVAGILVYNAFIVVELTGIPGEFNSVKIDSKYKIACNFEIKNKGLLTANTKKIQMNIPKETKILGMDIPRQYGYLYKVIDGGKNYNFAVFLVDGLKGRKSVKGSITFFQNAKWEKDYVKPISFSD